MKTTNYRILKTPAFGSLSEVRQTGEIEAKGILALTERAGEMFEDSRLTPVYTHLFRAGMAVLVREDLNMETVIIFLDEGRSYSDFYTGIYMALAPEVTKIEAVLDYMNAMQMVDFN